MPVRVDDEAGDQVELVARRYLLTAVDLGDRVEHDLPALAEERVQNLFLGPEVVVHEAVGHPCLVGNVRDTTCVEAAGCEHADRGVENLAPLVRRGRGTRGRRAQAFTASGQT